MDHEIERECPVCQRAYHANATRLKFGRQTTCSRACSYKLRGSAKKNGEERQCGNCGKLIYATPSKMEVRHGQIFCSPACAYKKRQRIVDKPYEIVAVYDRSAAMKKAWETRRQNAKPYSDAVREKARASAIQRIKKGGGVSKFETEAAQVFRSLGFKVVPSLVARRDNGTYACVFDIYLPGRNLVIECHGDFWHGGRWTWDFPHQIQVKNLSYEIRKHALAREYGLELRILWEGKFNKDPTGACLAIVR